MMKAILYKDYRQTVNLIKLILRSPKRLIPIVLFLIYLLFAYWSVTTVDNPHQINSNRTLYIMPRQLWSGMFIMLALIALHFIIKSLENSIIVFSMSEIDMMMPAPIPKTTILITKIVKTYLLYIGIVLFLMLLLYSSFYHMGIFNDSFNPLSIIIAISLFIILMINIGVGINLVLSNQKTDRIPYILFIKYLICGIFLLLLISIILHYNSNHSITTSIIQTTSNPILLMLFMPVKWAADLIVVPMSQWTSQYLAEFVLLILSICATFLFAVSRDENPYEPALNTSIKMAKRTQALKSGNWQQVKMEVLKTEKSHIEKKTWIPPIGNGGLALLWKNLIVTSRTTLSKWIITGAAVIISAFIVKHNSMIDYSLLTVILLLSIFYIIQIGSTYQMRSIKYNLINADLIKPMPISSWKIIALEPITGTILMSSLYFFVYIAAFIIFGNKLKYLDYTIVLIPLISYSCLCMQTPIIIKYPNWAEISQGFIASILMLTAVFFCLGIPIGILTILIIAKIPPIIATAVSAFACIIHSIGGIALGTYAYQHYDPTDE